MSVTAGSETTPQLRLRILLVDDHALLREGLRAVLEHQPDMAVIGECASGDAALVRCEELRPDVVLLDLKMRGLSALDTLRTLQARRSPPRVLVFTSAVDDPLLRDLLDAGASGLLFKDALQDELLHAIRHVAMGHTYLAAAAQSQLVEHLRRPRPLVDALTAREAQVLALIAQGRSNQRIAIELGLTEGTVKGHVSQVLAKLGVSDRTQAALLALGHAPDRF